MNAATNTGAGVYATQYAANWSGTASDVSGHHSNTMVSVSLLVTPATGTGTRTAGANTSVNGVVLVNGTKFSYINASSASVACDGAGNFLVTWSEEDYVHAGDMPDWNVWAQWYKVGGTAVGSPFEINATSKRARRYSVVAMDAQGDFVVTWQSQGQDGSGYGIYAQRYENTGATIAPIGGTNQLDVLSFTGSPTDVHFTLTWNGNTTGDIEYAGKANRTFTDAVQAAMKSIGADVTVSVIDSTDFGIEFIGAQGSQNEPSIFENSSNIPLKTSVAGVPGEFLVNSTTANDQLFPSIAMDPSGTFVITWTSYGQDGDDASHSNVYAKQFASNSVLLAGNGGTTSGPEMLVNQVTAQYYDQDQMWSSVAIDDAGEFVVTWTSYDEDGTGSGAGAGVNGENGVYARRFQPTGAPAGNEFLVNTFTAGNQQYSRVAMDAAGDFTVTWESFQDPKNSTPNASSVPTSYGIYAQRYLRASLVGNANYSSGPNGEYETEFAVNTTQDGDQRYPSMAMDDNGDFVVVWSGNGVDGTTGKADNQGVFLQRFDLPEDTAGPRVIETFDDTANSLTNLPPILEGETLTNQVSQIAVTFSETVNTDTAGDPLWVNSVLNPANWILNRNGGVVTGGVISVTPLPGIPNTFVVAFDRDPPNPDPLGTPGAIDTYALTASAAIQDVFGNALDGDLDGLPGGNFTRSFSIDLVPAPTVTAISPSQGPLAGGTTVTITGTNMSNATSVKFGSVLGTIVSDTASQIVAISPPGVVGTVDVIVVTASGTSDTSAADQFTYVAPPTVATVIPQAGPTTGGTIVTITGTGLANSWAVTFGGIVATIISDTATQIVVINPPSDCGHGRRVCGDRGRNVSHLGSRSIHLCAGATVTGLNPSWGPAAGGTTVAIVGTGMANASAVMFGTNKATIVSDSDTLLVVTSPPGVAGNVDVTVVTVGGTSATSGADQFTYVAAPTVTALNPSAGPLAGGTSVTITGTSFTGATMVSFGTLAATSFVVNSNTRITAVAPAGTGTVDVTIVNTGGTSATSAADQFTYAPVPLLTCINPTSGPVPGGTTVTIVGTGLANATAVKFGTKTATIQSDTATQIVVLSPAGTAGTVDVTVATAGGTTATSAADQFTYIPAPAVIGN